MLETCSRSRNSAAARNHVLHLPPRRLGERARAAAGVERILARGVALQGARHDALANPGEAKHAERHVILEFCRGYALAPDAPAVGGHVLRFRRNTERREIRARQSAELSGLEAPGHAVIREIGERMAERRQLPVE